MIVAMIVNKNESKEMWKSYAVAQSLSFSADAHSSSVGSNPQSSSSQRSASSDSLSKPSQAKPITSILSTTESPS